MTTASSDSTNHGRAELADIMQLVEHVEGWMSPGQAELLHEAARQCPAGGRIVEIGSFRGRSTIVLASAAAPDVEIVAVDPHAGNDRGPQEIDGYESEAADDHRAFVANLTAAGVIDRVRHVRKFSDEALDDVAAPIDVLYIDGAHRYAPARADIAAWGARVSSGGTMLIHDSFSSIGVTMAILRELVPGRHFRYVGRSRSMAQYQATDELDGRDRLSNALHQAAQLPWFAKNLGVKVLLTARVGTLIEKTGRTAPEWPY